MRILLFLGLALLSCKPRQQDSGLLADEAATPKSEADLVPHDPRDLPPAGRSLFDHVFHATKPFPRDLEGLIKLLETKHGATVNGVLIPFGRSLQKHATNAEFPRAVLAVEGFKHDAGCDAGVDNRLFIGFAEKADSLEIISFNDTAGRYEFQVVKDFSKPTAKLLYAPRKLCSSCHQGDIPIFSLPEWQETNGPAERGEVYPERVAEDIRRFRPNAKKLYGVPVSSEEASAGTIDGSVQKGQEIGGAHAFWEKGCGTGETGARCRRALVQLSLAALKAGGCKLEKMTRESPEVVEALAALRAAFPAAGVAMPNRFIEDREPEPIRSLSPAQDPLVRRKPFVVLKATNPVDTEFPAPSTTGGDSERFCTVWQRFNKDIAPLSLASYLKGDQELFFAKAEKDLLKGALAAAGNDWKRALDHQSLKQIYDTPALSRGAFLAASLEALGRTAEAQRLRNCYAPQTPLPAPEIATSRAARQAGATPSTIGLFRHYCQNCHASTGEARLDFMAEEDDAKLWRSLLENPKILERLEAHTMPPPPAMKALEEELERQRMITALKTKTP